MTSPSEKPPPDAPTSAPASSPASESVPSGEFGVVRPVSGEVDAISYGDSVESSRPSWAEPWNFAGWGHA